MNSGLLGRKAARLALLPLISVLLLAGCGDEATTKTTPGTAVSVATSAATSAVMATAVIPPDSSGGPVEATMAAALDKATRLVPQVTAVSSGDYLAKIDVCKLLSKEEIVAILGPVNYNPKVPENAGKLKRCAYWSWSPGDKGSALDTLVVTLMPASSWAARKEALKAEMGGPYDNMASVEGVGDEAFVFSREGVFVMFDVLDRSKAMVEVYLYPLNADAAKKLAMKVLENLP